MQAELPANKVFRRNGLHDLAIVESPRKQSFDDVALTAMHVCDVPIAVVLQQQTVDVSLLHGNFFS